MLTNKYRTIQYDIQDQIITITLNRPEVHNAFNAVMLSELVEILDTINKSDDIRVVLFTGAGKSFSAGADLNWMNEIINYSYERNLEDSLMISKVFYSIYTLKKPVITAINGAAIGGGMGFVGASDIVIASDKAKFSLSEVRIGVVPACISPYLMKKVSEGILKELFISGMRFTAQKALDCHLVNYVVAHDNLLDFAHNKAKELLYCGPNAIAVCKQLFYDVAEMDVKKAYSHTAEIIAQLRISSEAQEGMKAFLEKRNPHWHPDSS